MSNVMRYKGVTLVALVATSLLCGCSPHTVQESQPAPLPTPAPRNDVSVSGRVAVGDEHARLAIEFSSDDRRYIHDYYYRDQHEARDKKKKKLPPGLAKRDELPPGLQKQVQRNGTLPPGLEGRRLPEELERRLSPLSAGYIRLQVGRDIVLMEQRSRITVDVIKNIFP